MSRRKSAAPAGLEYVNDHLLEVAGLPPKPRVLDAGCGFGGTVFHWQRRIGGRYDGLTLSEKRSSAFHFPAIPQALECADLKLGSPSVAILSVHFTKAKVVSLAELL